MLTTPTQMCVPSVFLDGLEFHGAWTVSSVRSGTFLMVRAAGASQTCARERLCAGLTHTSVLLLFRSSQNGIRPATGGAKETQ